jgi:hypothetical protein
VDDLEGAQTEMRAAGFEAGEIVWAEQAFQEPAYEGYGWFFVHGPDGNVYCTAGAARRVARGAA